MRRSANKLQVSTFPFLAVLLCAMGALILFLLVMDQRAKIVAKHKAAEIHAARHGDRSKEDEARKADWEKQREILHQALLAHQQGLQGEADAVHVQLAAAGKKLEEKRADQQTLQRTAAVEATTLAQYEKQLKEKKSGLQESAKTETATKGDLIRLSAEVADLEKVLADLKALKKRDNQTYSLVPYRGKQGDSRKPLYVECTRDALVFHPDRRVLAGLEFSVSNLRGEVERRAGGLEREEKKKGKAEQDPGPPRGPYVLFLIRPDGITSYYQALSYLKGYQIDFGYEVVDQHWSLEFSAEDKVAGTPPWGKPLDTATTKGSPITAPRALGGGGSVSPPGTAVAAPNSQGGLPSPFNPSPLSPGGASGSGPIGGGSGGTTGGNPGAGLPAGGFSNSGGTGSGVAGTGGSASEVPRLVPLTGTGTGTPPPVPLVKAGPGLPFGGVATGQGTSLSPGYTIPGANVSPPPPNGGSPGPPGTGASGGAGFGSMPPGSARAPNPDPPSNKAPSLLANGSSTGASTDGSPYQGPRAFNEPPQVKTIAIAKPPSPPLGVVLGNRDFVITIACFSNHVTVYPGGKQHWWKGENAALTDKAFVTNVESLIAGRQKSVQPGQAPYRPLIRFQLAADGMGSYLHVYPQLRSLGVPMTRENLDD